MWVSKCVQIVRMKKPKAIIMKKKLICSSELILRHVGVNSIDFSIVKERIKADLKSNQNPSACHTASPNDPRRTERAEHTRRGVGGF